MSKEVLLEQYKSDVDNLKERAKHSKLADKDVDVIFKEVFDILDRKYKRSSIKCINRFYLIIKVLIIFLLLIFCACVLLNVHQPTSSVVLRNIQGFIYPGLKGLRFLAVPILKKFPSLTGLYYESCLVENPYFYVSDMECWPCENVVSVIDLTGFDNHSLYQSGTPYVIKTAQPSVNLKDLVDIYRKHKRVFDNEFNSIKSTESKYRNLKDLFGASNDLGTSNDLGASSELFGTSNEIKSSKAHISWRINRMDSARLIRNLFPRTITSERSGQSMERYVMVDDAQTPAYLLPNMECSYISVVQSSGKRMIMLKPTKECSNSCKPISVLLSPSYALWYNWWYWRPASLPAENATEIAITYITSYC